MNNNEIKINLGNTKGIKRKLDELHRIVIPQEFVEDLKLEEREYLEIYQIGDNRIYMRKVQKW